jgi:hypothetical protein
MILGKQADSLVERFMVQATKRAEECSAGYESHFLVGFLKNQLATVAASSPDAIEQLESMVLHLEKQ